MELKTRVLVLPLLSTILAAIGAVNWGLVGLLDFNLVEFIFGKLPVLVKIIYSLVGLSGLFLLLRIKE